MLMLIDSPYQRSKKTAKMLLLWILILLLLFGVPLLEAQTDPCSVRGQGSMDLSRCQFNDSIPVALDGLWEFHPNQLLTTQSSRAALEYVELPHHWNTYTWDTFSSDVNYATYRMKLKLPPSGGSYGIRIINFKTAAALYVNGTKIATSGQVGTSRENTVPYNRPFSAYFSTQEQEVEIVLQVSNFHFYSNSGLTDSVYFGTQQAIQMLEKRTGYSNVLNIVCLLFMSIYFMGESLHRRGDGSSVYFPLFCLSGAICFMSYGEKLLLEYIPSLPYEIVSKIQVISGAGVAYFFLAHTYHQFKSYASAIFVRLSAIHTIFVVALILLTPMSFYTKFMFYLVFILGYVILIAFRAVKNKAEGSMYILISILAAAQVILIMISRVGWLGVNHYIPTTGIPIFVLAQGLLYSSRFTKAYNRNKQLSKQLVAKMKDQEQFLVRTSHELKTPLNAIINISQSMIEGAGGRLNAAQQADLQLMNGTAQRLSYLVKDILDYEQLKNQRIRIHRRPIDMHQLTSVVIDVFRHLNMNDKVEVRNEVIASRHYVMADENRVVQILYNLLDNALKHTNEGSITITCATQGQWEHITVTDTGVGIANDQLDRIFLDYQQITHSSHTETSGIGIGLPITKQLVEMQGGHIEVRSAVGEGSAFTFSLPSVEQQEHTPLYDASDYEVAAAAERMEPARMKTPDDALIDEMIVDELLSRFDRETYAPSPKQSGHILIVDDSHASCKALTNLLELDGYTCDTARSGEAALELLNGGNRYNLCIMDVMMPRMSGFELCRIIRHMYNHLELPVLMATAGSNTAMNQAGFEAGANDFIHKPYDWTDLRGRVRTLVQLKGKVEELLHSERDMLRAQIKPHFLFNAINTILWMSKRNPEETRRLLHAFSDFLRGSFDFNQHDTEVPFAEELRLVEAYLSLERARFGDRLKIEYALEEQDFYIPPLLLQPLVENAVRHGVMEKVEGGTVKITSHKVKEWIEIIVADDGVGIDMANVRLEEGTPRSAALSEKRRGIGLSNINRRLRLLYSTSLMIEAPVGGGTIVRMRIRAERKNL